MDVWNTEYVFEATAIAAAVTEERGHRWLANQIRRGTAGRRPEVEIAMRALMVARGELQLQHPYG